MTLRLEKMHAWIIFIMNKVKKQKFKDLNFLYDFLLLIWKMSVILELDKVNFSYSKFISPEDVKSFYLSNIKAEISEGDFISVIGKNGSGKSTLVKLISRILTG